MTKMNAIISDKVLGISQEGIPFVIFALTVKGDDSEAPTKTIQTKPIFLVNIGQENIAQSGCAAALVMTLTTIGASTWEEIVGKAIQVTFTDSGEVASISNILDETKAITFLAPTSSTGYEVAAQEIEHEYAREIETVEAEVVE